MRRTDSAKRKGRTNGKARIARARRPAAPAKDDTVSQAADLGRARANAFVASLSLSIPSEADW